MTATVAAFDFDGTLTKRDCVGSFLLRIGGPVRVVAGFVADPILLGRVATGRGDRDQLKERVVASTFADRSTTVVAAKGRAFASDIVARRLRPDTLARLRWHQRQGHAVVIVSASFDAYLCPLAELLRVDHVMCTTLESTGGTLTGRLVGPNCRGPEKARRLLEWHGRRPDELWAYGDSAGDRELLALADHATWVSRRNRVDEVPAGAPR